MEDILRSGPTVRRLRAKDGSGGGSCAHGGRAYEARLNLILPAILKKPKMENGGKKIAVAEFAILNLPFSILAAKKWSRWVTLPHQLACRASALLVCHAPPMKSMISDFGFTIWQVALVPPQRS